MLISCVAYQDGAKLADIIPDQIPEYLRRPKCFVWVALRDPLPAELADMQKAFDLHPLAVEDALVGHQRPIFTGTQRTSGCASRSGATCDATSVTPMFSSRAARAISWLTRPWPSLWRTTCVTMATLNQCLRGEIACVCGSSFRNGPRKGSKKHS